MSVYKTILYSEY